MTLPYTVTPLASLAYPNAGYTDGLAINDSGQVVGGYGDPAGERSSSAFLYSGGTYTNINPGGYYSRAFDISNDGEVLLKTDSGSYYYDPVGSSYVDYYDYYVYDSRYGTYTPLTNTPVGYLPGDVVLTVGTAISDAGVVGYNYDPFWSTDGQAEYQGFLFKNGAYTAINVPGAQYTVAVDINDSGQVFGYDSYNGIIQGFLYDSQYDSQRGVFTTIPITPYGGTFAINNDGEIIVGHTFIDDNGVFTDINVPGAAQTIVWGISDAGVFGQYTVAYQGYSGFIYKDGVYTTVDDSWTVNAMSPSGQQLIESWDEIAKLVDVAPTAVALANATASILENTPTATHIKVADINVTDDALGSNILALTGADAASFEIVGSALYLKAGTVLDFESKTSYAVAVTVDDPTVGGTPDATSSIYALNVSNVPGVTITGTGAANTIDATHTVAKQPLPTNEEDTINAGNGNDTINALGGNDFINGGSGSDTMRGGAGNDTYVVDNTGDVVTENPGEGIDTVLSSVTYALGTNVENLTLTGTSNINGTGNAANNVITGNAGANVLAGGTNGVAGDTVSYATATAGVTVRLAIQDGVTAQDTVGAGTDTLLGFENLTGSAFNDKLTGNGSANVLTGGGGYDTYQFGRGGGQDAIINGLAGNSGATGELDFGSGIATNQLWFVQSGNNLVAEIMGSSDQVTIQGWYAGSTAQLQEIKTADGSMLDAQLLKLVQAMASYETTHPGFNPTVVSQAPSDMQNAIAAAWHH